MGGRGRGAALCVPVSGAGAGPPRRPPLPPPLLFLFTSPPFVRLCLPLGPSPFPSPLRAPACALQAGLHDGLPDVSLAAADSASRGVAAACLLSGAVHANMLADDPRRRAAELWRLGRCVAPVRPPRCPAWKRSETPVLAHRRRPVLSPAPGFGGALQKTLARQRMLLC